MDTPGRPSGVSLKLRIFSIPASQPQAITDVAKPVKDSAALIAQELLCAVIINLEAFIGNASANVSSIVILFFIILSLY